MVEGSCCSFFHLIRFVTVDTPKINDDKGNVEINIVDVVEAWNRGDLLYLNYPINCLVDP